MSLGKALWAAAAGGEAEIVSLLLATRAHGGVASAGADDAGRVGERAGYLEGAGEAGLGLGDSRVLVLA